MTVKRSALMPVLMLAAAGAFLLQACATAQEQQMRSLAKVYTQPYDQVWQSVEDLLQNDLKCALKKNDKKAGEIETEWVHRMDTEGTKRWMVSATVRKTARGVEVTMVKKLEMQDNVSKSLNKYKKEKSDTPSSSWKKTDVQPETVEDLYRCLEKKFE